MAENNGKTNGKTNGEDKTLEEFDKMGPSDQKLFVIRKLVEVMDQLNNTDIAEIYRFLLSLTMRSKAVRARDQLCRYL